MTDLIKQLQYLSRVTKDYDQEHMTSADYEMIPAVTKLAADRIEQLERERDEAMMTGHDLAKIEYRDLVSDLEAKLAKAIDEMTWALPILKRCLTHPNDEWKVEDFRAVLSELNMND